MFSGIFVLPHVCGERRWCFGIWYSNNAYTLGIPKREDEGEEHKNDEEPYKANHR